MPPNPYKAIPGLTKVHKENQKIAVSIIWGNFKGILVLYGAVGFVTEAFEALASVRKSTTSDCGPLRAL